MFETFGAAAEALLHTTCARLTSHGVKFVIVGGWPPYLRGSRAGLRHPGTRDVDVLFPDEDRSVIESAIKAMLEEGFQPSAKHAFQLLLPLKVGARMFVFNVDFMHPSEQAADPELMADIFDLGVDDESDTDGKRQFKSIAFQSAQVVFGKKLFSQFEREGRDVKGTLAHSSIPLLDEAGLVLSKLSSVMQKKRPRDAFDIFYTLIGPNGPVAAERIVRLAGEIEEIQKQLNNFFEWLDTDSQVFNKNVSRYLKIAFENCPSVLVRSMLSANATLNLAST